MGWQRTSVMEEKLKFIRAWSSNAYSVSDLCLSFGISRQTGHRLIRRYKEEGMVCFFSGSKAPNRIPHKTSAKVEEAIISLRKKHPRWGARKLQKLLEQEISASEIPAESTINKILSRNGLVIKRRKRPAKLASEYPDYESDSCNEIWSADYKGKFKMRNGRYCYPLTLQDKKSRFILAADGHYHPDYASAKRAYISAFRENGLPQYIHSDNGVPFAHAQSLCRYSKLCYWLIDQGIQPLFSDPGSPQQNGKHERMHRDLKAYCTRPASTTLSAQQRSLDSFVKEYNEVRPHEALEMETPASVYSPSSRAYRPRVGVYDYPGDFKVLKVMKSGALRWGSYHWVYISTAARGRYIGLEELGNGIWKVYYRNVLLGYMDEKLITQKEQYLKINKKIV